MPSASVKPAVWTSVIVGVVLALVVIIGFSSLNSKINATDDKLQLELSHLENQIPTAQEVADKVDIPEIDTEAVDEICDKTDGCNGWRLDEFGSISRAAVASQVEDELEDNNDRELYNLVKDLYDINEKDDVEIESLHAIGKIRSNEELQYSSDLSDTAEITFEIVYEIEYYENGNQDDTYTDYVKVDGKLTDLEDGIDDSELSAVTVEDWSKNKALTSN